MISASFCSCLGDRLLQFLRHFLTVRSECPHNSDTDFLHQISSIFKAHWSKKTFRRRLRLRLCLLLINSSLTSRPVPATDDSLHWLGPTFPTGMSTVRQRWMIQELLKKPWKLNIFVDQALHFFCRSWIRCTSIKQQQRYIQITKGQRCTAVPKSLKKILNVRQKLGTRNVLKNLKSLKF